MDKSCGSSSMIRAAPSRETAATYSCTQQEEEESGWTKYFEDFSNNNHQEQTSFCSSLVSDASSGAAAWRASHNSSVPKKLKKKRIDKISGDRDLEDTASSPVNSPKIGDMRGVDHMNLRNMDDDHHMNINSLGTEHFTGMKQQPAGEHSSFAGQNTDLKKKGLCLVPLNLFMNYMV